MNNTVDALKALYAALGGDLADVADVVIIPDMINAIAQVITDQGIASLPAVTAADEGKVLMVDSAGDWGVDALPVNVQNS